MKRRILLGLFLAVLLTSCAAPAGEASLWTLLPEEVQTEQQAEHTLLLIHSRTEENKVNEAAEIFAEELKNRTDGRLQVSVYSNNTLGGRFSVQSSLQSGILDIRLGRTSDNDIPWLPVLADIDLDTLNEYLDSRGTFYSMLEESFTENGYQLLALFPAEYRVLTSDREIRRLEDLQDLTIRITREGLEGDFWRLLGCKVVEADYDYLYSMLQQGLIQAQENTLITAYFDHLLDDQAYVILTNFNLEIKALYINRNGFESLSAEDQAVLLQSAEDAVKWYRDNMELWNREILQDLKLRGVKVIPFSPDQRQAVRELAGPLIRKSLAGPTMEEHLEELIRAAE